jgi:hypothetical protein
MNLRVAPKLADPFAAHDVPLVMASPDSLNGYG